MCKDVILSLVMHFSIIAPYMWTGLHILLAIHLGSSYGAPRWDDDVYKNAHILSLFSIYTAAGV